MRRLLYSESLGKQLGEIYHRHITAVFKQVEFAEIKASADGNATGNTYNSDSSTNAGFMNIPDGVEDEGLPFN